MQIDGTAALAAAHRVWARLEDVMNLIAAAAIFFLMFVGVFQVIGRTAFNTAIHGYIDYMEQASALFAFLGIAYAQRLGSHIGMDLTMGWRPSIRWKIELLGVVVAIAIITVRWSVSTGVITRFGRGSSHRAAWEHVRVQTPQPRHRSVASCALRLRGCAGSFAETSVIASTGHKFTHLPQPLHVSPSTCGRKLVVWTGCIEPNRRWAIIASQQQPQQLHTKLTPCCTFSPNCTRFSSYAWASRSLPSAWSTRRANP